jgi:membrane-bound serine protease (ClpP class)
MLYHVRSPDPARQGTPAEGSRQGDSSVRNGLPAPARLVRVVVAILAFLGGLTLAVWPQASEDGVAVRLPVTGAIGPATDDYIARSLEKARAQGARLVILEMDTPGGLDTSMREGIKTILNSPIPVATWVGPSGARAASAGTYILYASHIAAMAPGTNLGAATPVQIGGADPFPTGEEPEEQRDESDDEADEEAANDEDAAPAPRSQAGMEEKIIEDAVAYIRGLAQLRGRNAEWAEKAVREAASLSADDALEENVIDVVARNIDHLLEQIDGRVVDVPAGEITLRTEGLAVETIEPDWRTRLLSVITNPNVAYILMIVGIYGIILEFYNPGMMVAGVTGAISLLLALYAFQVLPINFAGLALMGLGIALLIAEGFAPSFGILGIGGVVAFVIGSVMLIDTDMPGFGISWYVIGAVAVANVGFFMVVLNMAVRAMKRAVVSGHEALVGKTARVVDWKGGTGRVRLLGETWNARAASPLKAGQDVRIETVDGLTLEVAPETAEPTETEARTS